MKDFVLALAIVSLPFTAAAAAPTAAPSPPASDAGPAGSLPPPPPPPPAGEARAVDPAKDLRADLRQRKAELIARNLTLTPEQAAAFWPIYKRYDDQVAKLQEENLALVKEYLAVYDKLDDGTARNLQERFFLAQEKAIELRRGAAVEVGKVLPAKLTMKFVQLDRYYTLLAEVQVQSRIPQIP